MIKSIKNISTLAAALLCSAYADAQTGLTTYFYGQDAFKYSQQKISGTARMQGMGGGYSSLGADATNASANPAGLGFYNRSEFSISPVFSNNSVASSYLGNNSDLSTTKSSIGQAAVIFSNRGTGTRKKRSSFAIGYTRLIDFNNDFNYAGTNQRSSIMDSFVETANNYGATSTELDAEFDTRTGRALSPAGLYYQSFMIDPDGQGGYRAVEPSVPVEQNGRYTETGSLNQWNFSYGVNFDDKTYLGASLGIRSLNYNSLGDHTEAFPNGDVFSGFDYFDDLTVQGVGVNLTVGAIIKAAPSLQFGVNVTTPTAMAIRETYVEGITIRPLPNTIQTDYPTIQTNPNDFDFRVTSPLRGNFGATVFLPKKIGIVSADVEYVGYRNMNVKDVNDTRWSSDQQRAIQDVYKDVINFKVGSEIRLENFRVRGGVNYLADPYANQSNNLDRSETFVTLGGGFRNDRFFVDIAGVFNTFNSAYTPYTLSNPEDYASANLKTNRNNFVISLGAFF